MTMNGRGREILRGILIAAFSGLVTFVALALSERGKYIEKVERTEAWREKIDPEIQNIKVDAAQNAVVLRQIQVDIAEIRKHMNGRNW